MWVTFDDTEVLAGWPARADYPTEEALYDARSAWLDANPDYISARHPHPDYDDFSGFPVTFDVGIVELDEAAPVTTFGELAPLGTAEELAGDTGQGRNDALVENVGYGIQSVSQSRWMWRRGTSRPHASSRSMATSPGGVCIP